jgi:uncharacterized protein
MKIRSITYFCNPQWPLDEGILQSAGEFIARAQPAYEKAGYEVQTVRLATVPFPSLINPLSASEALSFAQALEEAAGALGFNYIAIGPALPSAPESYAILPEILQGTENIFASGLMSSAETGISIPAVNACAKIIHQLGPMDANGFSNLYFAALANVPHGAPFFPAAYHEGETPSFAIATEAADLAVSAFSEAQNLAEGRHRLRQKIESHAKKLNTVAASLTGQFAASFGGIDFSLASYPEEALSLGTAFERLGIPAIGQHGSLAAAAVITEAIDQADFPHAGFSGLMMPVLEDATLARRAAQGILSVKDLLLYSAVCGTGLDTIPLSGDTTPEQLTAILLDLATLAQRLNKPLTARLMPIPGKKAGDATDFDFAFFANSRVMALEAEPLTDHLAGDETFKLVPR